MNDGDSPRLPEPTVSDEAWIEDPPAHVWSAALSAAVEVEPDAAGRYADLVPDVDDLPGHQAHPEALAELEDYDDDPAGAAGTGGAPEPHDPDDAWSDHLGGGPDCPDTGDSHLGHEGLEGPGDW